MKDIALGLDPGERNFGYAVVSHKPLRILEVGQIDDTIRNLTHKPQRPPKSRRKKEENAPPLTDAMTAFNKVLRGIFSDYTPDGVYSERFQARGTKSRSIETVSFMNGIIAFRCRLSKIYFSTFIAGTWKNAFNRHVSLDTMYEVGKKMGFSPHEVDAICIALTKGGTIPPPSIAIMTKLFDKVRQKQCQ